MSFTGSLKYLRSEYWQILYIAAFFLILYGFNFMAHTLFITNYMWLYFEDINNLLAHHSEKAEKVIEGFI